MSDEKPELENAIRLAIEAADAANSSAADIAEMKRQYKDAADKIETTRKSFSLFSFSLLGGVAVALGASGFVAFKTISDLKTAYATQIEALGVFSESVAELRTTLSQVEGATEKLYASIAAQEAKTQELDQSNQVKIDALSAEIEAFRNDAAAMQPQIATAVQSQIADQVTTMSNDLQATLADLQVAISKMIASGFETMPVAAAPAPAAPAPRATPTVRTTPAKTTPARSKRPAPRPAPNPFKFP